MLSWKPSIVKTRRGHIGHIRTERTVRSFTITYDETMSVLERCAKVRAGIERKQGEKHSVRIEGWKDPEWHQS